MLTVNVPPFSPVTRSVSPSWHETPSPISTVLDLHRPRKNIFVGFLIPAPGPRGVRALSNEVFYDPRTLVLSFLDAAPFFFRFPNRNR